MTEIFQEGDRYRIILTLDQYPDEPYDEGASPILQVNNSYYNSYPNATHLDMGSQYRNAKCDADIEAAANKWGADSPKFETYLRAFHGVTRVITWASSDYTYVTYDDECWRKNIGAPEGSISLEEWKAYCLGDVYVVGVEKRVTWRTDDPDYEDRDRWENVEALGGYYGYEYAREAAAEEWSAYANKRT